ncbi:trans-aconitate methyltransferase [Pullulanibacillus pueri]|uniref:SAM-dependent methyltransferase n=1 Tax=Pullulanibacillus pueri TaxID=1437324 RepID=A0A8J3A0M6_9BACL|nr:class I SAM-dependent methyltransferase [Pullulanibacillus pueri]MBM7684169.1 trans-aconitate methyltransferase [Pullulanibacillus pueri]GGH88835.1 SAM-dependent methyltransferase [Pullulanibacillus pueri]
MDQKTKDHWNAHLYDGKHAFVSKYGNDLVDLLEPKKDEHILDLGCGTGDLAHRLHKLGVNLIGIDKSENMVEQAKKKYPFIKFLVNDATELHYQNEFNAVFSNATLHWVKPPELALKCIYNSLKPGGRLVAEFGGKGNVQKITNEIIHQLKDLGIEYKPEQCPWYFPSIGEYSTLMEEVGFRVTFAQHFDRPTPLDGENGLRNWIDMFAKSMFDHTSNDIKAALVANVENNLKDEMYKNGTWIADYKRIRVVGYKEE